MQNIILSTIGLYLIYQFYLFLKDRKPKHGNCLPKPQLTRAQIEDKYDNEFVHLASKINQAKNSADLIDRLKDIRRFYVNHVDVIKIDNLNEDVKNLRESHQSMIKRVEQAELKKQRSIVMLN